MILQFTSLIILNQSLYLTCILFILGPVHQAFLWEGLFEELITYLAPQMLGEKGVPGMESPHQLHLAHQEIKILENNIRIAERKIENV